MRYRTALRRGGELLNTRPRSTNLAIDVCTTLRGIETNVRKTPGTARFRGLLANWEAFLHAQEEFDPLIRMAVGHYEFEAVDPPTTPGSTRLGNP